MKPRFSGEEYFRHYEATKTSLEQILGPMHEIVMHAKIPFQLGGPVDMYMFPNGIPGTAFATLELIEPDGNGPKPNHVGPFELLTFTRQALPAPKELSDDEHPFNKMVWRMCGIMSTVGRYSFEAVLNPGDTCELPDEDEDSENCLILDEYDPNGTGFIVDGKRFCLLLCLEVFPGEMEYAREHGSGTVLQKLKEMGHYPYSDLDREPVY